MDVQDGFDAMVIDPVGVTGPLMVIELEFTVFVDQQDPLYVRA